MEFRDFAAVCFGLTGSHLGQDDWYKGYFIPEGEFVDLFNDKPLLTRRSGTVLIYNTWYLSEHNDDILQVHNMNDRSMNRNSSYFPDYDEFRPERYLTESGSLATESIADTHGQGHFSFGAGRRYATALISLRQRMTNIV